jgi:hypothetical protein
MREAVKYQSFHAKRCGLDRMTGHELMRSRAQGDRCGMPLPQSAQEKADIAGMSAFDDAYRIYSACHTDSSQASTSFLT